MTAGRGIIHSEMPQQEAGPHARLPALDQPAGEGKDEARGYRDIQPEEIPVVVLPGADASKVIAGTLHVGGDDDAGPIQGVTHRSAVLRRRRCRRARRFTHAIPAGHHAFVYPFEGSVEVGAGARRARSARTTAGVLSDGDDGRSQRRARTAARFILLAARPLREPVVQYGPFVMNTREEIEQAIRDYQNGELAAVS